MELPEVPSDWLRVKLPEIATLNMGQSPSSSDVNEIGEGLVFFQGKAEFGKLYPTPRKYCTRPAKIAESGDILLSVRAPVGPTNLANQKTAIGRGLAAIRAEQAMDARFLLYYFRRIEPWLSEQGTGTTFKAVSGTFLKDLEAVLVPLVEQKAIADKLDALLAQVETNKARLERIPNILKRFRQSVLAAAVSGRLTEKWRNTEEYSELNLPLSKSAMTISHPKEWRKQKLSDACNIVSGNAFKSSDFVEVGAVPAIKISNIQYGQFEYKNQQYLPVMFVEEFERFKVMPGDLLMALTRPITNETLKVCRYPLAAEIGLLNQRVAKFNFHAESEKSFFELIFQSDYFKVQVSDHLSETLQPNLSPTDLKKFKVAIPSEEEQTEILRRVDQLFAHADRIEQQAQAALERVNKLTQSILAKAFRGELTEQWRRDHPELISGENSATALLERIKAERESRAQPKRRKSDA